MTGDKEPSRFQRMVQEKLEARRREAALAKQAEPAVVVQKPSEIGGDVGMNVVNKENDPLFVPQDDINATPGQAASGNSKGGKDTGLGAATASFDVVDNHSYGKPSYLSRRLANNADTNKSSNLDINESRAAPNTADIRFFAALANTTPASVSNVGSNSTRGNLFYGLDPLNSLLPADDSSSAVSNFGRRPSRDDNNEGGKQEVPTKRRNETDNAQQSDRCTCSISTDCPLAAAKGVKDCRTSLAPVYARNKKVEKNAP